MAKQSDHKKDGDFEVQLKDWENKYKRARADYINLERRVKEEKKVLTTFVKKIVLLELLPVYDSLSKAAEHDKGCAMILKQFSTALENMGVTKIEAEGTAFDPAFHEAVEVREGEAGKVLGVLEEGFTIGGDVIRPAKVWVGKGDRDNKNLA